MSVALAAAALVHAKRAASASVGRAFWAKTMNNQSVVHRATASMVSSSHMQPAPSSQALAGAAATAGPRQHLAACISELDRFSCVIGELEGFENEKMEIAALKSLWQAESISSFFHRSPAEYRSAIRIIGEAFKEDPIWDSLQIIHDLRSRIASRLPAPDKKKRPAGVRSTPKKSGAAAAASDSLRQSRSKKQFAHPDAEVCGLPAFGVKKVEQLLAYSPLQQAVEVGGAFVKSLKSLNPAICAEGRDSLPLRTDNYWRHVVPAMGRILGCSHMEREVMHVDVFLRPSPEAPPVIALESENQVKTAEHEFDRLMRLATPISVIVTDIQPRRRAFEGFIAAIGQWLKKWGAQRSGGAPAVLIVLFTSWGDRELRVYRHAFDICRGAAIDPGLREIGSIDYKYTDAPRFREQNKASGASVFAEAIAKRVRDRGNPRV